MDFQKLMQTAAANQQVVQKRVRAIGIVCAHNHSCAHSMVDHAVRVITHPSRGRCQNKSYAKGSHSHRCRSQSCDRAYWRILITYTNKEGVESLLSAIKRSTAEIIDNSIYAEMQRSQTVKSFCDAVKWSSSKNEGQDFLTPVVALTMASMGVSPPCMQAVEQVSAVCESLPCARVGYVYTKSRVGMATPIKGV